jgi:Tfp pilus assembly protein PilN
MVTAFDYLHSARAGRVFRCLSWRPARQLHGPILLLCAAFALFVAVGVIEHARVADAQRIEATYRSRYERSERALREANLSTQRIRTLLAEDRRAREIAGSGRGAALRLTRLAALMPPHVWLTAVAQDEQGLRLDGRARTFDGVGALMEHFASAPGFAPSLLSANAAEGSREIAYSIRLAGNSR